MDKLLPEVCSIQYGFPFDSARFSDTAGMPLVRIRDVVRGYSETYTTEECSGEYIVQNGDILVGMDGEFNVAKWNGGQAYLNQRVCRLIPKDTIDSGYLFYFMPKVLKQIETKTPFVTVKHLSAKQLNAIIVPLPSLDAQKHIASVLDKVSDLISLRKQQLTKLDELVKARFVEMFGNPVQNDKKWPLVSVGDIAEIRIGPFGTMLHKEDYVIGGHALVNPSNIVDGKICTDPKLTISNEKFAELASYALKIGDIVLGRRGEMGRCAVVYENDMLCGTGSMIIRPNEKMQPYFLQSILSNPTYKKVIEDKAVGITMMNLSIPIVSALKVPQLPIDLQKKFIAFMAEIDNQKLTTQQSLDKLELLKKSLMQQYFE